MTSSWQLTREMFLSIEEVELLLGHLRAHGREASGRARLSADIDRLVIEGLLFSGLRTTEFCRLTLADTVIGQKQSVFVVTGLRGRDRTVHVPVEVSQLVEQFVRDTRPSLLPEDVDPNDPTQPLIFGERKNPLERTGLYRRVVRVLNARASGHGRACNCSATRTATWPTCEPMETCCSCSGSSATPIRWSRASMPNSLTSRTPPWQSKSTARLGSRGRDGKRPRTERKPLLRKRGSQSWS